MIIENTNIYNNFQISNLEKKIQMWHLIHFILFFFFVSVLVLLIYFLSSLSLSSSSVASLPVFTLNKNLHGVFVSILGIGGFGTHTYETSLAPIFVIGNNLLNLTFNNMFASVLSALIIN